MVSARYMVLDYHSFVDCHMADRFHMLVDCHWAADYQQFHHQTDMVTDRMVAENTGRVHGDCHCSTDYVHRSYG